MILRGDMRAIATRLTRTFPTRLQLLVGFSVVVALFVATLAVGVGKLLRQSISASALSGAEQTGRVFAELELGDEEYDRDGALSDPAPGDLDVAIEASTTLQAARIWSRDGELLYWSGRDRTGRPTPSATALKAALDGGTESVVSGKDPGQGIDKPTSTEASLKVYLPILLTGDTKPRGVLEVHLPYEPVQAEIDAGNQSLVLILGLGALLFYGALLPSVLRGSRALADTHEARQKPLQRRLREAMRDGELMLAYQPKLDLRSGKIHAVEALLRWQPSGKPAISPAEFLPLVEATPVMRDLTSHVFELALRQSAAWTDHGIELDIAVNISASDLSQEGFAERLAARVRAYGLSPSRFTIELTESAVSQDHARDHQTLSALRTHGFKLSIDDFGTGESSLSRLHLAEFHEVKIDRSFISQLDDPKDSVLVASIIDLAQALGATVVAEGVESEAIARRLERLGCDLMQGYHVAPPLPPGELVEWLRRFPATPNEHDVWLQHLSATLDQRAGGVLATA